MSGFHQTPILVPTDYSSASVRAVQAARSIAHNDSDVVVVHVGQDYDLVAPADIWGMGQIALEDTDQQMARLQKWAADNQLGNVRLELRAGDPGLEVCAVADDLGCRLIVVPSHGRSGFQRVLLGSVAERIIRHCHCSVLVLRRSGDECDGRDWLPRKRVVVPVDLSESTATAIDTALELADTPDHIDVVNVIFTVDDAMLVGSMAMSIDELSDSRNSALQHFLKNHDWPELKSQILSGDPGLMIAEYATDVAADLIVIPSHGFHGINRLILGSTTERVMRHADCPVLVLRRDDAD